MRWPAPAPAHPALRARIADAARTDPLTGLLNRRALEELLELELERATRADRPLSVIVGDLDAFAAVNERQGHAAGDAPFRPWRSNALKWKRRMDHAARIGGEEFALLLPETDERGAFIVAERLRRAVHRSFVDSGTGVNFSFGVATAPHHGEDAVDLLRAADSATAAAKELGGDRTVIYSDEVARTLAEYGTQGERRAPAGDRHRARRGARHPRHRHRAALAHRRPLRRADGALAGLRRGHVEHVRLAGVLHDIGKIGIPDRVLSKPGPLDAEEWQEMYTHPEIGARLLSRPEFDDLRAWILAHHERPDGLGYPRGLGATRSRSRRASSRSPTPTRR